jgi:hypothetical protein
MAIFSRVSGAQKGMSDCKVKVNGAWKQTLVAYAKVNGAWKESWSKAVIYLTSTAAEKVFSLSYTDMQDYHEFVVLGNVVVKVYNGSDQLLTTFTVDEIDTVGGSWAVYADNDDFYGEVGFYPYFASGILDIHVNINRSGSTARKFVVSVETVSFR